MNATARKIMIVAGEPSGDVHAIDVDQGAAHEQSRRPLRLLQHEN